MTDEGAGLDILWRHVLDHWDDDAAHHAFLQTCQAERRLADAAARYRGMSGDHLRHEIAEKKLKAILVMALSEMQVERPEPTKSRRGLALVLVSAVLSLGMMLAYWFAFAE